MTPPARLPRGACALLMEGGADADTAPSFRARLLTHAADPYRLGALLAELAAHAEHLAAVCREALPEPDRAEFDRGAEGNRLRRELYPIGTTPSARTATAIRRQD